MPKKDFFKISSEIIDNFLAQNPSGAKENYKVTQDAIWCKIFEDGQERLKMDFNDEDVYMGDEKIDINEKSENLDKACALLKAIASEELRRDLQQYHDKINFPNLRDPRSILAPKFYEAAAEGQCKTQ